jgi:hypothetical protein
LTAQCNAALLQGLSELGWTVGRNLRIDYRWGAGDPGIWDIDQRIERALQIEREFMREILARVIDNERAVMCESVGSRLAELIDSQFPDLVDGSLRKTRDELRDLKVEIARFTSVTEELRRALDNERARTASGDVIPLPQRRQAH